MEWSLWVVGASKKSGQLKFFHIDHVLDMLTIMKKLKNKFTVRGVVRGGSLALCAVNVVGCGLAYTFGKREKEEKAA
jgi:hypothetical protein